MSRLKAALIGCGHMGRKHAARTAAKTQELEIDLVAYCDVVEESAEATLAEFGGQYSTTDPDVVIGDDAIDVVIIATNHGAHHPQAIATARAGKHILLEKPMCVTYEEAVEVAEAVEKAGVKVAVNHKFRHSPAAVKTRELIPNPRLSHGQLTMGSSAGHWLWQPTVGGGLLISTASHTVDLLSYLMGGSADRVYAEGRLFSPEGKGDDGDFDGLVGTILWKSGALSTVISSDQGSNEQVSKFFQQVWDGERSAVLDRHIQRATFGGCEIDHYDPSELPKEERDEFNSVDMLASLVDAIRTDGETMCTVRDAAHTVAICNALDEAARTGKPQQVPA